MVANNTHTETNNDYFNREQCELCSNAGVFQTETMWSKTKLHITDWKRKQTSHASHSG